MQSTMRELSAICFCILFSSCGPKFYPLEGNYPKSPFTGYSDKNYSTVWNNTIQYLSENLMDIKTDSSAGLIISRKMKLMATYENEDGSLYFPDASVVVPHHELETAYRAKRPEYAYLGDVYILLGNENGKTSIKISITKITTSREIAIKSDYQYSGQPYATADPNVPTAHTTGVLENSIFNQIK